MSEALFDNRYRYDYIYPRGRSGETLRAVDTHDQGRPLVIKRPAPQDAPPLRAAQAQSIQAEKKALERLSGHRCLPELRGSGQFRAGGMSYLYIAMDRAEGETLESLILDGGAMPELEALLILDQLLDILIAAHAAQVVYNDVDAKHLFWERARRRLKLIDWGNAVMMDEPGHPAGVGFHSDIYQVGELIYFIYQGGKRLSSDTSPEGEYTLHFSTPTPPEIQTLIWRATHPNSKQKRYSTLRQVREALNQYRAPLEAQREQIVQKVRAQVAPQASKTQLEALDQALDPAWALDPYHPPLVELRGDIRRRLQHLAVQADFDAVRIYLEAANWGRAMRLMEDLRPQADPQTALALNFLIEAAGQFQASQQRALPPDFERVTESLLNGQPGPAAQALMTLSVTDARFGGDALLLADRLGALWPEVILLRPPLARLQQDLGPDGAFIGEWLGAVDQAYPPALAPYIERYGRLAIQLSDIEHELPAPLQGPLERAQIAAQHIVAALRQAGNTVYGQAAQAQSSLALARQIDPANPHWAALSNYLGQVPGAVESLAAFRPQADGSDLVAWTQAARGHLTAWGDISDPAFKDIGARLQVLEAAWGQLQNMLLLGSKAPAAELLSQSAMQIRAYNPAVADWLESSARTIREARESERYSANQTLAGALLDGLAAWDQGQMGKAGEFARRALLMAQTEGEKYAAERLAGLADLCARWLTEGGAKNPSLSDEIEQSGWGLFLKDERAEYERFSFQMKSEETYLKAMRLGIASFMQQSSSVAWRALYLHYVLRSVLEVHRGDLAAADFWRQAALITYPQSKTHPILNNLDAEITRRELVARAETAMATIQSFGQVGELRAALNAPLADESLKEAYRAAQLLEDVPRLWADSDFRALRDALAQALDLLRQAGEAGLQTGPLLAWLTPYQARAAELVERRAVLDQAAMVGDVKPDPAVLRALEQMVEICELSMGPDYARQPRLWRDLYRQMLRTHTQANLSKAEKLAEFEKNFAALFVDKHPAYKLFKRWYEAAQALPEDVQEELQIHLAESPSPEGQAGETEADPAALGLNFELNEEAEIQARRPRPDSASGGGGSFWTWIIAGAAIILLAIGGFAAYRVLIQGQEDENPASFGGFIATPTLDTAPRLASPTATQAGVVILPTNSPSPIPSDTPIPSETPSPTASPTVPTLAPSLTPSPVITIVTNTPPPQATATPSFTPSPSPSPARLPVTPSPLPPNAEGVVDVLAILAPLAPTEYAWDARFFSQGAGGVWQLGASLETAGSAPITVIIPADYLDLLQTGAADRLRRVEVEMELSLFDEARLTDGQVFFGLGIQNSARQRYSGQVQVRQAGVVSLGLNENGTFRGVSQLPMSPIRVQLALERDEQGQVSFFVDGQRLGQAPVTFPPGEALNLVLYNAGGGMFVSVSAFRIELAPSP
jgi:hypothetical protein